jgi:alpha-glucosidase (family GH31 glycosyl hydrolase)
MTSGLHPYTIVLRHQPYGEQNPYIPLPYERSPRNPSTGDIVVLNIETDIVPKAISVWCVWQTEGIVSENRVAAVLTTQEETSDHWQVMLPAFRGGETIHYRLFAENGEMKTESEEFTFTVTSWEKIISVISIEKTGNSFEAILSTEKKGLNVRMVLESDFIDTLALKLSTSSKKTGITNIPLQPESLSVEFGEIKFLLRNDPFSLEFIRMSDGIKIQSVGPMRVLVDKTGTLLQYQLSFVSPSNEAFYGFGERFNALDQRGNHLDNYVFHQYTGQGKRSYIPIPFFISSRGYGVWLKTDRNAEFDLAASKDNCWSVTGNADDDSSIDINFFFHVRAFDIVKAFTEQTGKPKLPPSWAFGLWMSSNDWNCQSEVLQQMRETQKHQIPASVLVIEAWSDEITFYVWNDAQYHQKPSGQTMNLGDYTFPREGRWPDPKAMVDELHQNGLRLVLWQNPAIKQGDVNEHVDETLNLADQSYAIEHGYVVLKADGSPHRVEPHAPWFRNSLVLDFTNPDAANWWLKQREYLVKELGVDGFKTDGGEHIWDTQTRFHNGMRGTRGINNYPLAYESAYDRFMQDHRNRDFVLFSRAGYTGAQQYPCHWAGDEKSTWDAFRATLHALLNAGLCGIPFVGWDIAGFSGPLPSSDLYLRATAFSTFCPIMQYHSDVNKQRKPSRDRTPWNIQEQTGDTEVIPAFRMFANLRMNLLPYILSQAQYCCETGLPLMRTISLEYPHDANCRKYPYEYLFGDSLLIAPVTEEGVTTWPVFLPEGKWRDFWTGKIHNGPVELKVDAPRNRIPVYQKKGSVVVLNPDQTGELGSYVGNSTESFQHLTLQIFPGSRFETPILSSSQDAPILVTVDEVKDPKTIFINIPAIQRELELKITAEEPSSITVNHKNLTRVDNVGGSTSPLGWQWDVQRREIRIHLPVLTEETTILIQ